MFFYIYTGSPPGCVNFDFERGNLYGWTKSGTAFNFQPTYGDNPTARRRRQPARMQGKWWIGTFEKRPNPRSRAGAIQGDRPTGTLSSRRFRIVGNHIDFLIGGGCNIHYSRAELVIDGRGVVLRSKGKVECFIYGGSRGGSGGSVELPKLNVKTYNKRVVKKKSEPRWL